MSQEGGGLKKGGGGLNVFPNSTMELRFFSLLME